MDPARLTTAQLRQLERELAPCARAFERAKKKGRIAIGPTGSWQEVITGMTPPPRVENPDQLELADLI